MTTARTNQTDVIVIGGGSTGENVADRAVKGGLKAVLIEAELVGGECSYWACMPSKALLRPGAVLAAASRVQGAESAITGDIDAQAVLARRDSFTSNWDDSGQVEWLEGASVQLVRGKGRLSGERRVEVTKSDGTVETWEAVHAVVLANGSVPIVPPSDGLEEVSSWGTREATSAKSIPDRLVVLGGGVSGTELAQAFARLGSKVTIIARHGLLSAFPKPAADLVLAALRDEGIDVRLDTEIERISQETHGPVTISLPGGESIECDEILVSTGRKPARSDLGLETVGISDGRFDAGPDGRVENILGGWLYAVGDVAGKAPLTHQGKYEARATGDAIAARARGELGEAVAEWSAFAATADDVAVPQVVFTDPEIAMVGRTAEQAEKAGITVKVVEIDLAVAGSSLLADGYKGWAQMVVDEDRGVLIGVTFAGQDVAEMLHAATIAIVGEVPLKRLWHAVPAYPSMSEVWLRLLEEYGL